ncbi:hypothetical protein JD844_006155 [Phrynosoma platyrhinos]|uniref:Uncharacterized protein n=1 Tax=Phrynosoma platyrhinos TaxID=52577 RepID=A0ABQ7TPX0_PHRPL|nr:hypothetical protein JD844_006155 [Phrynosoma platyrhinos]
MPAQQQLLLQQAQAQLLAAAVQQSNAAAAAASSQQPGAELPAPQNQPQTPQLALSQPIQLTAQDIQQLLQLQQLVLVPGHHLQPPAQFLLPQAQQGQQATEEEQEPTGSNARLLFAGLTGTWVLDTMAAEGMLAFHRAELFLFFLLQQGCSRHQISFSYLSKTPGASCRISLAQDSQHR